MSVHDKLLSIYGKGVPRGHSEQPEIEDFRSFGWLRGIRDRAESLELRKKDGRIKAISYSWLECADFDPDKGITLVLPGKTIHISGTKLNAETHSSIRLYEGIVRRRVPWVCETDRAELMQAGEGTPIVESIDWED